MSGNTQLTKTVNDGGPESPSSKISNHIDESFSAESASWESSIDQGNLYTLTGGQHRRGNCGRNNGGCGSWGHVNWGRGNHGHGRGRGNRGLSRGDGIRGCGRGGAASNQQSAVVQWQAEQA